MLNLPVGKECGGGGKKDLQSIYQYGIDRRRKKSEIVYCGRVRNFCKFNITCRFISFDATSTELRAPVMLIPYVVELMTMTLHSRVESSQLDDVGGILDAQ